MEYLTSPDAVQYRAQFAEGYDKLEAHPNYPSLDDRHSLAKGVVEEWSMDWSEDEGFGSSDMTYLVKDYLSYLLDVMGVGDKFTTGFPKGTLAIIGK